MKHYLLVLTILVLGSCQEDKVAESINLEGIAYNPQSYELSIDNPIFPAMLIPADNPLTVDGVDLGRHLFYDKRLSGDGTMSCAGCHGQTGSFTDNEAVSLGIDGIAGNRSSMSLLNVGFYNTGLFWDGSVMTLEEQALLPVEDEIELHHSWPLVETFLQEDTSYQRKFRTAFGISNNLEINKTLAAKAIAQFERTLISTDGSKYDRELLGLAALTDQEADGLEMFFDVSGGSLPDAQCWHCHNKPFFTDHSYANNGLDYDLDFTSFADNGRGAHTGIQADNGEFRVPTLRNIEFTAPYMHDGRFNTLEEVLDHYISGGQYSIGRHPLMDSINLDLDQKAAIIAFLKTLSDPNFNNNPSFSTPF